MSRHYYGQFDLEWAKETRSPVKYAMAEDLLNLMAVFDVLSLECCIPECALTGCKPKV